jgi:hypothetical protein
MIREKRLKSKEIMQNEVDKLSLFGYVGIIVLFVGMIVLCFLWGFWEYKKPKDPGPLFIDLDRTIKKRLRNRDNCLKKMFSYEPHSNLKKASTLDESSMPSSISSLNETVRVRGDLRIPKGEVIPFDMVVEGNLVSNKYVTFQGGLHVKGHAVIGAHNRLKKSVVCEKDLFLFEDVVVYNCVDCDGFVFVKNGVRVGVGKEGGGIASANKVYLENVEGPLKIQSEERICIVGNLEAVVSEDLKHIIEVKSK